MGWQGGGGGISRESKEKADCFFFWGRPGWLWLRMPVVVPPNTRPSPKSNRPGLELSVSQPLCHRTGAVQNKLPPSVRSILTALSASALSSPKLVQTAAELLFPTSSHCWPRFLSAPCCSCLRRFVSCHHLGRGPLRYPFSVSPFPALPSLCSFCCIPVVRAPQFVPVPVLTNPTALSCPRFVTTLLAHARHTSPRRLRTPRPTTSCHHR